MPARFETAAGRVDLWSGLSFTPEQVETGLAHYLGVVGRLKPGVTIDEAGRRVAAITERLVPQFPVIDQRLSGRVRDGRRAARRRASRGRVQPHRRRGLRVAHRLRQSRQSSAGARRHAQPRVRDPRGDRRVAVAPRPSGARRKPRPRDHRRRRRPADELVAAARARERGASEHPDRGGVGRGHRGRALRARPGAGRGPALRAGARVARLDARDGLAAPAHELQRQGRDVRPIDSRRRPDRAGSRAPRGRVAPHHEPGPRAQRQSRLRSVRDARVRLEPLFVAVRLRAQTLCVHGSSRRDRARAPGRHRRVRDVRHPVRPRRPNHDLRSGRRDDVCCRPFPGQSRAIASRCSSCSCCGDDCSRRTSPRASRS